MRRSSTTTTRPTRCGAPHPTARCSSRWKCSTRGRSSSEPLQRVHRALQRLAAPEEVGPRVALLQALGEVSDRKILGPDRRHDFAPQERRRDAVSYTHLTLPTKRIV